jgi:hypothetical protein
LAPHATTTAPLGVIEPPGPAVAVIVLGGQGATLMLSIEKLGRSPAPLTSLVAHSTWTTGWLLHAGGRVRLRDCWFCGVVTPAPVWLFATPARFWYATAGRFVKLPLVPTRY